MELDKLNKLIDNTYKNQKIKNKDIGDIVISSISKYTPLQLNILNESTYRKQCNKTIKQFSKYFNEEIGFLVQDILSKKQIDLSSKTDTSSFIYIGSEIIKLLKDNNINELNEKYNYGYVLPFFYEFIQSKSQPKECINNVFRYRLNEIHSLYEEYNNFKKKYYFRLESEELEKYKSYYYSYFISFYYSVHLYKLYKNYSKEILMDIINVLKNEKTTKNLLEDFYIDQKWDLYGFISSYNMILKKTM